LRIKLEARSSPPGRRFGLRSPCGLLEMVGFDLEEDPGWVRVAPNFARRPLFGGTLSPLSPSALLWSPCALLETFWFELEDSVWVRLPPKFARRPPSFFGGGGTTSPLSPAAFGGFRWGFGLRTFSGGSAPLVACSAELPAALCGRWRLDVRPCDEVSWLTTTSLGGLPARLRLFFFGSPGTRGPFDGFGWAGSWTTPSIAAAVTCW